MSSSATQSEMATNDTQVDVGADTHTDLKTRRARLKANVTRTNNQIKVLMKDPENQELVSDLSKRLDERFDEFMCTHRAFFQLLSDEDDIKKG